MQLWTSHYYQGGVSLSTWWRGKPSGASDLSNHQGRHRPEVRPLGATGSQLCSVGCLGENKQWQPLIQSSLHRPIGLQDMHTQHHMVYNSVLVSVHKPFPGPILTSYSSKASHKLRAFLWLVCDYLQCSSKALIVIGKPFQERLAFD